MTSFFARSCVPVRRCDTLEDLDDVAQTIAAQHFQQPFSPEEVSKVARSVWRYEQLGKNWAGRGARTVTTAAELDILMRSPDGHLLRSVLECAHCADPDPFAVSPRGMAEAELIDGWTDFQRYARGRVARLVEIAGRGSEGMVGRIRRRGQDRWASAPGWASRRPGAG